jgi:hypothetical protein
MFCSNLRLVRTLCLPCGGGAWQSNTRLPGSKGWPPCLTFLGGELLGVLRRSVRRCGADKSRRAEARGLLLSATAGWRGSAGGTRPPCVLRCAVVHAIWAQMAKRRRFISVTGGREQHNLGALHNQRNVLVRSGAQVDGMPALMTSWPGSSCRPGGRTPLIPLLATAARRGDKMLRSWTGSDTPKPDEPASALYACHTLFTDPG